MAKNFLRQGSTLSLVAAAAAVSGDLVVQGVLAGIALHDAANGAPLEVQTDGVWQVKKASGQAWTVGAAIYVTPSTGVCTTATTAGNLLVGVAVEAAASADTSGVIRLNGCAPAARTA